MAKYECEARPSQEIPDKDKIQGCLVSGSLFLCRRQSVSRPIIVDQVLLHDDRDDLGQELVGKTGRNYGNVVFAAGVQRQSDETVASWLQLLLDKNGGNRIFVHHVA